MPLNILVNATPLLDPITGIGNYTYQVAKHLGGLGTEQDYTYYYNGFFSNELINPGDINNQSIFKAKKLIREVPVLSDLAKIGWRIVKRWLNIQHSGRFEVYWEPNYILLDLPVGKKVASVHDFSFYLYPQWHNKEVVGIFKKRFFKKIAEADSIITGSQYIKEQIVDILNVPTEMVNVINHGVDKNIFKLYDVQSLKTFSTHYDLPESFILYVGSIEPRKNLLSLLDAYRRLPDNLVKNVALVLAGFKGWENREIMDRISSMPGRVKYLGYLTNIELAYLYNLAIIFVYPSLYEGFGLPPLEAMACGAPVVVSGIPVHREIYGDAALYFDPLDIDDMAASLTGVLEDAAMRKNLSNSGLNKAGQFTWERCAAEHLRVFERAANVN